MAELHDELDGRISAVKAMYAQKTKALLSQISTLEDEVRILKLANKEHNRSKLIAALQQNAQERETVVEVLKAALVLATGRTRTDIDELVLRKTTGQPEKFKPRSREELAVEIATLRKQLEAANVTARRLESENASLARAKAAAGPIARFGVDVLAPLPSGAANASSVAAGAPQGAAPPAAPGGFGGKPSAAPSLFGSSTSMLLGGPSTAAGGAGGEGGGDEPDPVQTLKMALAAGSAIAAARQKASAAAASAGLSVVEQSSSSSSAAPTRAGSAGHLRAAVAASRAQVNQLFGGADGLSPEAMGAGGGSGAGGSSSSAEVQALRDRVAELTAIKEEQQAEIADMHEQLQQMTALEKRATDIASRYGTTKDSVEGTQRDLERLAAEHNVALDELQRARSELAQLRAASSSSSSSSSSAGSSSSSAAATAAAAAASAAAVAAAQQQAANAAAEFAVARARLEETIAGQNKELDRLRRLVEAKDRDLEKAAEAAVASARANVAAADSQKAPIEKLERELEVERYKAKRAEDEASSLREQLRDKTKKAEEVAMSAQERKDLQTQLQAQKEAVKRLEDEILFSKNEVSILRTNLAASEAKVNAMKPAPAIGPGGGGNSPGGPSSGGRRAGANVSPSASGGHLGGFNVTATTTTSTTGADDDKAAVAELQVEISSLRAALASAQGENSRRMGEISALNTQSATWKAQVSQAQTQATALESALSARETELKTAHGKLEASDAHVKTLQKEVEGLKAAVAASSNASELERLNGELARAKAENSDLVADKERLGIEVEMLRDSVKSLTETSEKRRLQLEVMTTQLADAEAKASSSSSSASEEVAKLKEQLVEANTAAENAKKEAAAAHKASEAAVKKADAAAKAAELAMREVKNETAKKAEFEKKYNEEKSIREQREEWFASEKERADSDYETALQTCEAAEKKLKAAEALVEELKGRVKALESGAAPGTSTGTGGPSSSPQHGHSSLSGNSNSASSRSLSLSPNKQPHLAQPEAFQAGGTLTSRITTTTSLSAGSDILSGGSGSGSGSASAADGRSGATSGSGQASPRPQGASAASASPSTGPKSFSDIQLKVVTLMQERQAYACLSREAARGMETTMQTVTQTESRADSLLKTVATLLGDPAFSSAAASDSTSPTNASSTKATCLQAISVCEQRLAGTNGANGGGPGLREEVERLRGEEQSNIVTVTTCHAAMESLQSYVHALTFLLKQSGVEEADIPPAPPALLTLAREMVQQLHSASAAGSPRDGASGAEEEGRGGFGASSVPFSSPARGASVFASGSLFAQLGTARAERNGYAALARESARRLFALKANVGNMSAKCDELEAKITEARRTTSSSSAITALCVQAISLCEQRITDATMHLQRLKAEEASNGVTVTTAHEAIESLQMYAAALAERLLSLTVPTYYLAPLGADVAAMAAADHFTRVPVSPAVLPPPPLDLMALAETMVAELEFTQQSVEDTAAAAADAKKFLRIGGLEDLTPPTPSAVSLQPSMVAAYSASMPPSNVVSASPSTILPASAATATVVSAAPVATKEPIAMRPMSANRHHSRPDSAGRAAALSRPASASSATSSSSSGSAGGGPSIPRPSSAVRRPPASASAHAAAVTSIVTSTPAAAAVATTPVSTQAGAAATTAPLGNDAPSSLSGRPSSTAHTSSHDDDDIEIPEDDDETPHIADRDEDEKDIPRATVRPKSTASASASVEAAAPAAAPAPAPAPAADAHSLPPSGKENVSPTKGAGGKKGSGGGDDGIESYEDEGFEEQSAGF